MPNDRPSPHVLRIATVLASLVVLALAGAGAAVAAETAPPPSPVAHWHILTRSAPAILAPGAAGTINSIVVNLGDAPVEATTEHPVEVSEELPPGVVATGAMEIKGEYGTNDLQKKPEFECPTLHCSFTGKLPPMIALEVRVPVEASAGSEGQLGEDVLRVTGANAASATGEAMLTRGLGSVPFGVERYELTPETESGAGDLQAGSHPFQLTTTLAFNQTYRPEFDSGKVKLEPDVPELAKNIDATLPAGLVGNENGYVVPQCSDFDFATIPTGNYNECPADTAVGAAVVTFRDPNLGPKYDTETVPVFNLVPEPGEPARFGFEFEKVPVTLDTSVQTGKGYAVEVDSHNISSAASVESTIVTIWGVPKAATHNDARGWECLGGGFKLSSEDEGIVTHKRPCVEEDEAETPPYLTLPTTCATPLASSVLVESWKPGEVAPPAVSSSLPEQLAGTSTADQLEGCDKLPFTPSVSVQPDERAASTPSGLNVELTMPQSTTLALGGLAEADLGQNTVALPVGIESNPGAANGLEPLCATGEAGLDGSDTDTGAKLVEEIDAQQFTPEAASCPDAAKIGTVKIHSPLLEHELTGAVYLGDQDTNPFAPLLVLYLLAEDPVSGVRVKLAGEVNIGPAGQLVTTFKNTPPVPFETLELNLFNGARATQTTPSLCRLYTTEVTLVPSSGEAAAVADSSFKPEPNPDGVPCPEAGPLPFSPSFEAGSTVKQAGAFTPFTLTIARPDGDGALKTISMELPAGLAALLASVPLCPEPQAANGTCGSESLIGHSTTLAGLGGTPYELPGRVYLTGPYDGAPFGLSAVTQAKAGPFNIGTVVVRSAINVNKFTAAATIDAEASTVFPAAGGAPEQFAGLPELIKGLPSQVKALNVSVERPNFEFNPTNCSRMATVGTLTGYEGTSEPVKSEFEATNCGALPFTPKLTATVAGQGSKTDGTSFAIKVESPGLGQANIHKVDLTIPAKLPSRLETIQKACLEAVFNANPASCDEGSVIGEGIVQTPVFKNPLKGPAYLVSHGGAAFPDVEFVLQGEGVTIIVDAKTYIHEGVTYSKLETAPDAPFTTFEALFPAGPHSALTPHVPESEYYSLCKTSLTVPTEITGQNGAFVAQTTKVAITGCKGAAAYKVTKAQLLAKALKACKKDKKKSKRVACEKAARKKYGPKKAAKRRSSKKRSSKKK
jgi:hypothetical protein